MNDILTYITSLGLIPIEILFKADNVIVNNLQKVCSLASSIIDNVCIWQ